jgi:ABC-type transporter Mla subunit MlaD
VNAAPPNGGESGQALADLNRIMDRLTETIAEETARARTGQLAAAAELSESKLELARLYAAESQRTKSDLAAARPDVRDALRQRHAAFQSLLQTNLTVLATVHAVSEGIIRGVSGELARKRAPSTYGASGHASAPSTKTSLPLALSRTL